MKRSESAARFWLASGQGVRGETALDVAELDRLATCIETEDRDRSLRHARQLGNVLDLHRVHAKAGMLCPRRLTWRCSCSALRRGPTPC